VWDPRCTWSSVIVAVAAGVLCGSGCAPALAAGDANRAECSAATESSPGFRGILPDCRAYELVTPPYGGGQPAYGVARGFPPISVDGEHLLSVDFAGLAGTENEEQSGVEFGAIYKYSRIPTGWTIEPLEPPAARFPRRAFVAGSADLSRSLWAVIEGKEGEEIGLPQENDYAYVLREVVTDGPPRFTAVGPVVAPGHEPGVQGGFGFLSAAGDLSHSVVEVRSEHRQLWPGDATRAGASSLYEYGQTSNSEPVLVGVKNGGPLSGVPHVNEGAELVSECGTILGSHSTGSIYNAISTSGSVIYFTAQHAEGCPGRQPPADEVYARINGSQTIDVSEPTMTAQRESECSGVCRQDEEEESKRSPARFEGASENGAKAFITTEQPLLNADEDSGRDLYEVVLEGGVVKRLIQISHAPVKGHPANVVATTRISQDGSHVYYVATGVLTTTPNGNGEAAEEGGYNLYAYDTHGEHTSFVANLLTQKERAGLDAEQIRTITGVTVEDDRRPFATSPDGRFMVFLSVRHLTGSEDTSTVKQIFEYDGQTGTLVRVSVGQRSASFPDGYGNDGNTTSEEEAPSLVKTPQYQAQMLPTDLASSLSLAGDGAVVFTSRNALVPQAVRGGENVYEYRSGNVDLISAGSEAVPVNPPNGSRLLGTDYTGRDVFFYTNESLVPQDSNTQSDWYDAREDGGFAAPLSAAGCEGDHCQGALSEMPVLPSAGGSTTQAAGENTVPPASTPSTIATPLTRAQRLAHALRACEKKPRRRRAACAGRARKLYGHIPPKAGRGRQRST
jgi:hypothetical protein